LVREDVIVKPPWNPYFRPVEPIEDKQLALEALIAISDAADELDAPDGYILFDLHTNVATRIVVMPAVMHAHDQDCGRA